MKVSRALVPLACALGGFLVGVFVYPGPYQYGNTEKGANYRVNRLTGVQEFASSRGWVSERELVRDSLDGMFGGMSDAFRRGDAADKNP